ncbi:Uncharacterized membrane protein YkgB [Dyadobacter sp. SG02]|uniref:DUF417 family protein n=1 Tax=Dyadobacter sp. SG02 TaxID=1855291 RepID=UPI0008C6F689|nr:DUF417 family protein [Dyadobacter sp. SG02]SEI50514.1 Uncharacterized membrane protein YkgB [Dyadobacter sp. SG02]
MKNLAITTEDQNAALISEPALAKLAAKIEQLDLPFRVMLTAMTVMLLWAGAYKMTDPGSEGIEVLVNNSPLISWHFQLFGVHAGGDLIGLTEIVAALLMLAGLFRPQAGIVGGSIAVMMFFVTSTMLITTPDAITHVNGVGYMSFLGLFLYKDLLALGVSLYLITRFGRRAAAHKG